MIDNKIEKNKIVSRQSIQQSLRHTLAKSIDKLQVKNISKENKVNDAANFTVNSTVRQNAVQNIVSKTTKNFNVNYRNAKERRRTDDMQFRLDRILRKIRPNYSEQNYIQLLRNLQEASFYEKYDFIIEMEKTLAKHNRIT
mgnify:FL=1|tara:strand:+ start:2918 stop:3340 length:423 start_codon:yes stop_codon:yes gene_type:complete